MKRKSDYMYYAYQPPHNGKISINGDIYYAGEDFRTVERFKEYKNVGFNWMKISSEAYDGENWETSDMKLACDRAYQAGLKKIIVVDQRIFRLVNKDETVLIGNEENALFKNEKELDEAVASYVAPYKNEPWFAGIQLLDEPVFERLDKYVMVAKSLQRAIPEAFLHGNLLPMGSEIKGVPQPKAFEMYLDKILQIDGMDIMTDPYPFRMKYIIYGYSITVLQIMAQKCRENNRDLHLIMQAFACPREGRYLWRHINERDMYWQVNLGLGFGCRKWSWYTYFPKKEVSYERGSGEINGVCMMNQDGSRTKMYYYVQRIIREIKHFEKVHSKYRYKQSYICTPKDKKAEDYDATALAFDNPNCPIDVEVKNGVALVTELENGTDRLYMVENVDNIIKEYRDNEPPMEAKISLGKDGKKRFYYRGKKVCRQCKNGTFVEILPIGEAIFVEVKK